VHIFLVGSKGRRQKRGAIGLLSVPHPKFMPPLLRLQCSVSRSACASPRLNSSLAYYISATLVGIGLLCLVYFYCRFFLRRDGQRGAANPDCALLNNDICPWVAKLHRNHQGWWLKRVIWAERRLASEARPPTQRSMEAIARH